MARLVIEIKEETAFSLAKALMLMSERGLADALEARDACKDLLDGLGNAQFVFEAKS